MPHLFVARPRLHDLMHDEPSVRDNFRWETINAVIYKAGGVIFVIGSILFSPPCQLMPTSAPGYFSEDRCSI